MNLHAHLSIEAARESAIVTDRSDLDVSVVDVGVPFDAGDRSHIFGPCSIHVGGTPAERANFLRQLAATFKAAADDLEKIAAVSA